MIDPDKFLTDLFQLPPEFFSDHIFQFILHQALTIHHTPFQLPVRTFDLDGETRSGKVVWDPHE
jgi:hypothetical protein